jgi:penicillin-binding protein 1A
MVGMMNVMMKQTIDTGTGRKAAFEWPAAGKTGTTQNSRDAWFVGYTANLTTGVWFGNDNAKATKNITGGSLPVTAWHEFMVAAHEGVPVASLPGTWTPEPQRLEASVPDANVPDAMPGAGTSSAQDRPLPLPVRRQQPASQVDAAGGFEPPARTDRTASIKRPSADVGGPTVRRETSILDVILGNN